MPRYVARPRARGWVEDDTLAGEEPFRPSLDVDGPKEVDTGLVTASGETIYRLQSPIGFGRDSDW
jgi:hypothetical protein